MQGNPFNALYVTEHVAPEAYVELFSPLLIQTAGALFEPGNVVLMGVQGSGKSMLLSLLRTETRVAFARVRQPFPPDELARPFVGASVNLSRTGAASFGQRPIGHDFEATASAFADFLNYAAVLDLLDGLVQLAEAAQDGVQTQLGFAANQLGLYVEGLACHDCWRGALEKTDRISALREQLIRRLTAYRDYLDFNVDAVDTGVLATKTRPGAPIVAAAELLEATGLVGNQGSLIVTIDQYEDLVSMATSSGGRIPGLEQVVHQMMGYRDARVSYRIGARRHAWPREPRLRGTSGFLEQDRNYRVVDIDATLAATEHTTRFARFAEDVFRRRLTHAGYDARGTRTLLKDFLGASPKPAQRVEMYRPPDRLPLLMSDDWDAATAEKLRGLSNALETRLAEAYVLQKGIELLDERPWETRPWWRKERLQVALLQVAAANRQRTVWAGAEDVVTLAGENILVFLTILRGIWAAGERDRASERDSSRPLQDPHLQAAAIAQISTDMVARIRAAPNGDGRHLFATAWATYAREQLLADPRMSNPGHHGFSVLPEELATDSEVEQFLTEATDYGVLSARLHTSRNRREDQRLKYYLAPIYAPRFQLPAVRTKEPKYLGVEDVRLLMLGRPPSGPVGRKPAARAAQPLDLGLFE